jgi:hypothetical protein
MGEPHRIVASKAVSAILEDIQALSDEEIDFLFAMLNSGMWDEWDCSLVGGIEIGLGAPEIRVAVRAAAIAAKYHEDNPTD